MSHATDMTDDLWDDMTDDWAKPEAGREAHALRVQAAEADRKAAESWERSDTDGFLSQWAHGLTAQRDRAQARLIEQGGTAPFLALFDLTGQFVPARRIEGRFGPRWMVLTPEGRSTGTFLPYMPKRRQTLAGKGYVEGMVERPAVAAIMGGGRGLSGAASCYVGFEPTDQPWEPPTKIVNTDRWAAAQPEEVQS